MVFVTVDENGNIVDTIYNLDPTQQREYMLTGSLPEGYIEVDTNTNKPTYDWTQKSLFDGVVRVGDSYVLNYRQGPRFETTSLAAQFLEKQVKYYQKDNNRKFESRVDALVKAYPEREIASWDQQVREAKAYLQEQSSLNTPLIAAMAVARGVTEQYLADRILTKSNEFAVAYGALLGKKQRHEDLLETLSQDPENTANWNLLNEYGW